MIIASALTLVIGLLLALGRLSRTRLISVPTVAWIEFFRGFPLILLILFPYLLFPVYFKPINPLWYVVIGLTPYNSAVMAESYRAGILSLDRPAPSKYDWRTDTRDRLSTWACSSRAGSNGSPGNASSWTVSAANAAPTVTGRPVITRPSSMASPAPFDPESKGNTIVLSILIGGSSVATTRSTAPSAPH